VSSFPCLHESICFANYLAVQLTCSSSSLLHLELSNRIKLIDWCFDRNFFNSLFSAKPKSPSQSIQTPKTEEKSISELPSHSTSTVASETTPITTPQPQSRARFDQNRNVAVFGAGAAFFALSLLITRRSLVRRRLAANPAFYTDSLANTQHQARNVRGGMEAVEALNIATINVLSLAMMSTGGLLWYFDINSMDDARRKLRGGLGVDGTGRDEKQTEEEFEEWMATALSRKEAKEQSKMGKVGEKSVNERGRER